jgi:hypothetical protein
MKLKKALGATAKKRGFEDVIKNCRKIMENVEKSEVMRRQWINYQKDFEYAVGIEYADVCGAVVGMIGGMII